MDNKYDSILKEKKQSRPTIVDISNENAKKPDYAFMSIVVTLVILIISYVVYFNTVLDGKGIFFNDLNILWNEYYNIVKNLDFNYDIKGQYSFIGSLNLAYNGQSNTFEYNIHNDGNKVLLDIHNDKTSLNYYTEGSSNFIKSSNVDESYIKSSTPTIYDYISLYSNIGKNIESFLENKSNYKKSIYFENERPVVKIEINLNRDEINHIIGNTKLYLKDDYNVDIALINGAITNNIFSIKVIVNNKTKKIRDVYQYRDGDIIHTNDQGINEKINISNENGNFTLKYYNEDVLYSVLMGSFNDGNYEYMYQVIDSKYNIKMTVDNNENSYQYLFDIYIDTEDKKYDIDMELLGEYAMRSSIEDLDGADIEKNYIEKEKLDDLKMDRYHYIIQDLLGFDLKDVFSLRESK